MTPTTQLVPLTTYAKQHNIPLTTLRLRVKEGKIPGVRLGQFWYVQVSQTPHEPSQHTQILTFFTHAGGAGKSSLVRDLGFQFALGGHRVLLIDTDPQSNLTRWLGFSHVEDRQTILYTTDTVELPQPQVVTFKTVSLHCIPANINVARAEQKIPAHTLGMLLLRAATQNVSRNYDVILIDSPPYLGYIPGAAALASQGLVVPLETSVKGIQALHAVVDVAKDYRQGLRLFPGAQVPNSFIRLIIPNKFDQRTNQDRQVLRLLDDITAIAPVTPPIPYKPAVYKKASNETVPIQMMGDQSLSTLMETISQMLLPTLSPS